MKIPAAILVAASVANALVVPDVETANQIAIETTKSKDNFNRLADTAAPWDPATHASDILSAVDGVGKSVVTGAEELLDDALDASKSAYAGATDAFEKATKALEEVADVIGASSAEHLGGHDKPDLTGLTTYQVLSKSKHATRFASLIDEHDDLVQLLNSTDSGNLTLFVPTDAAFDRIPDHLKKKKPGKEVLNAFLRYHIGLGDYPALRILHTHTLPTALDEPLLGDRPQRIRTSVGLDGVKVNFYSRVVAADFITKNGVIHAVDAVLAPPFHAGRNLSLLPSVFSTLLLAYEKTDFVSFIHDVTLRGSTVFAPSNAAFSRLGPKANAFLFNTETGIKYLRALLKYQIAPNATLYSDTFYGPNGGDDDGGHVDGLPSGVEHRHLDLPTLLGDKTIAVDTSRWGGWIRIRLNGYVPVTVQDGISKNGVIQVVGRVPIPPHKHHKDGEAETAALEDDSDIVDGEIDVDDLKARLEPYVDDEKPASKEGWNEL